METLYLQAFTRLPLEQIARPSSSGTDIVVTTPHKGKVILASKRLNHAMFSAARQSDKDTAEVLNEISTLERESVDFLIKEWLSKPN